MRSRKRSLSTQCHAATRGRTETILRLKTAGPVPFPASPVWPMASRAWGSGGSLCPRDVSRVYSAPSPGKGLHALWPLGSSWEPVLATSPSLPFKFQKGKRQGGSLRIPGLGCPGGQDTVIHQLPTPPGPAARAAGLCPTPMVPLHTVVTTTVLLLTQLLLSAPAHHTDQWQQGPPGTVLAALRAVCFAPFFIHLSQSCPGHTVLL